MSQSNSAKSSFFSLLENKSTIFKQYQPSSLQSLNLWLAQKSYHNDLASTLVSFMVGISCAIPSVLPLALLMVGGWIASLTAIGGSLFAAVKGWAHYKDFSTCKQKVAFEESVKELTAPESPHVFFKSQSNSFNQLYSFTVDDNNIIWYALRESRYTQPHWRPLFLENYQPQNIEQVSIQADGQNFMAKVVTSEGNQLYYKKIMTDSRKNNEYYIQGCLEAPESIRQWFSLPVFSLLKPSTWGEPLRLKTMARWVMSNDGDLRHHKQDKGDQWHTIWNCTTVYMQDGNALVLYDPYVAPGTEVRISLPQGVKVTNIQATSSRIFVFGEETRDGVSRDVLYERTIDYDVLGLNPIMPYTDDITETDKRFLPLDKWKQVELPIADLTGGMTVIQTGLDKHVEIRLEEAFKSGMHYYYKEIEDKSWNRTASNHIQELSLYKDTPAIPIQGYLLENATFFGKSYDKVVCHFFNKDIFDTRLMFYNHNDEVLKLTLRRTSNMVKSFIDNAPNESWIAALTATYQIQEHSEVFDGKCSAPVTVHQTDQGLVVKGKGFKLDLPKSRHSPDALTFGIKYEGENYDYGRGPSARSSKRTAGSRL